MAEGGLNLVLCSTSIRNALAAESVLTCLARATACSQERAKVMGKRADADQIIQSDGQQHLRPLKLSENNRCGFEAHL